MAVSIDVPGLAHGSNPIPSASRRGPLLATGGVHGVDRATGRLPESLGAEVRNTFDNLGAIIVAAGGEWADVVHMTVHLAEGSTRSLVNAAWERQFPDPAARPARHIVTRALPGGLAIQIEAMAYIAGDPS
jgi:2-iminobutanoate/2-iminopropanoate deaminase